jgi:hypothetical protein
MHHEDFAGMQPRFGLQLKADNTVIEKWPTTGDWGLVSRGRCLVVPSGQTSAELMFD